MSARRRTTLIFRCILFFFVGAVFPYFLFVTSWVNTARSVVETTREFASVYRQGRALGVTLTNVSAQNATELSELLDADGNPVKIFGTRHSDDDPIINRRRDFIVRVSTLELGHGRYEIV